MRPFARQSVTSRQCHMGETADPIVCVLVFKNAKMVKDNKPDRRASVSVEGGFHEISLGNGANGRCQSHFYVQVVYTNGLFREDFSRPLLRAASEKRSSQNTCESVHVFFTVFRGVQRDFFALKALRVRVLVFHSRSNHRRASSYAKNDTADAGTALSSLRSNPR